MTKPILKEKNELTDILTNLSDFQYVMLLAHTDYQVLQNLKEAFRFFCHESVIFSMDPLQITIGPIDQKHIIDEENFYNLQKIIRRMYFLETEEDDIIISDDDPPQVRKIKMQLRKSREDRRKAKAAQAAKDKSDMKFSDLVGSMTINDCGLNIKDIWDVTYYAFHDQLKRMGWRDQFNINQKAALAGAKLDKKQLKHWMRSIANSDN